MILFAIKNVSAMSMLATIDVRETEKFKCSILFKKKFLQSFLTNVQRSHDAFAEP